MNDEDFIVVTAVPLSSSAQFVPYGTMVTAPLEPGSIDYSRFLPRRSENEVLSLKLLKRAGRNMPIEPPYLERHPFSDQLLILAEGSSYLSLVAPTLPDGEPDLAHLAAFVISAPAGIIYSINVWHSPIVALDSSASFLTCMWTRSAEVDTEKRSTRPIKVVWRS